MRPANTYKSHPQRTQRSKWHGRHEIKQRPFAGAIELNRSSKWLRAKTYAQARENSPSVAAVR